jgi:hypothetical protein
MGKSMQQPFAMDEFITSNRFDCVQYSVETLGVESTAALGFISHRWFSRRVHPSSIMVIAFLLKIACWKHKTHGHPFSAQGPLQY